MAGLGAGLALFIVFGIVGLTQTVVLVSLQFLTLVVAGYVAGRFAHGPATIDGSLAGLLAFLVIGAVAIAGSSNGPSPLEIAVLGVVAAVLGAAGGVLADRRR
ncbi:MAG: hypothetical protein EHM57_04560 [Actinobacteria bacterium]|nr:MAG: hypothetical protein EHM57_04560 [Actinomycetota bacterium]